MASESVILEIRFRTVPLAAGAILLEGKKTRTKIENDYIDMFAVAIFRICRLLYVIDLSCQQASQPISHYIHSILAA